MKYTNIALSSLACFPIIWTETSHAGAFKTSSTSVAETPVVEFDIEFQKGSEGNRITLPKVALAIDLVKDVEFAIKGSYRKTSFHDSPHISGLGDIEIAGKWNFLKTSENAFGISMAIEPTLKVPHGRRDDLNWVEVVSYEMPIILGYSYGNWDMGAEIGYGNNITHKEGSGYLGVIAMRRVSPALKLGGELIVENSKANISDLETHVNFGLKWAFSENVGLQTSIGKNLSNENGSNSEKFELSIEFEF